MILTVTANLALDITYEVPRLVPAAAHRVHTVHERAGGKGVNVARVVRALGGRPLVAGLVGGTTGATVRADLAGAALPESLTPISGETRRTVTAVSDLDGGATMFTEPGPIVTSAEWANFLGCCTELMRAAEVVVLSGSLPRGVPDNAYAALIDTARHAGIPSILDTSGPALLAALPAGPNVIKPNAAELRAATGHEELTGARELLYSGAGAVIASLGPVGLLAVTPQGSWRARPPQAIKGNPTGAGDAAVAALAMGLAAGTNWPDTLTNAVAASAAAVASPVAGAIDQNVYTRLLAEVTLEELDDSRPHR